MIPKKSKEFLSVSETAELIGRSRQFISYLCRTRRFPGAEKVGNNWIIPWSGIMELYKNPVPPRPEPEAETEEVVAPADQQA